jgi:energy-coupling factor transporter ATP-binding protein EcfA2
MPNEPTPDDLPPAYFLSLTLENVRCFGPEQTLDLSEDGEEYAQWTLLLGDNGTGKTTLLQALAHLLPFNRHPPNIDRSPVDGPIQTPRISETRKPRHYRGILRSGSVKGGMSVSLYSDTENGRIEVDDFGFRISDYGMSTTASVLSYAEENRVSVMASGYGASREMDQEGFEETDESGVEGLFTDDEKLPNANDWLLQTDYASKSGKEKAEFRLDQIREILAHPDTGILPDIDDLRFAEQEGDTSPPRVEFHTPYGWVTIDQLSLGYRTMIAWVVDLARRLFERYPESDNPLAEPAVCLVDEIDLHLHPKWQRKIIDFLSGRFPNTQFVVTAHSPLVVQAAEDANIALLERVEVEDGDDYVEIENNPARIRNWRVDQILTSDLFDLDSARPPKADELMQEREEILTKEELTKDDEERLDEIEEELGDLPTGETPDDIEAMNLIRQAARELKEDA